MKTEISAGGIIVRYRNNTWEVVVLRDMNNSWTFPKGKIEKGEILEKTARREIEEESGLHNLTFITKLPVIQYTYGIINKTVHYFLFESTNDEPLINQTEEGIHDARWMTIDTALDTIGYPETNKKLLWTSHQHLTSKK